MYVFTEPTFVFPWYCELKYREIIRMPHDEIVVSIV